MMRLSQQVTCRSASRQQISRKDTLRGSLNLPVEDAPVFTLA